MTPRQLLLHYLKEHRTDSDPEKWHAAILALFDEREVDACGCLSPKHATETARRTGEGDDMSTNSDSKPRFQYYYRVTECKAKTAEDSECICWHDEGSGPFDNARNDDVDKFLDWRQTT